MTLFTIGYGGRSREGFLELLHHHGVRTVVDVRLRPDRATMGIWVKAKTPDLGIEKMLADGGISYRSLIELGNVFLGLDDWPTRYQQLLDQSGHLLVSRLADIPGPICLMCAEKRVNECHRRQIADFLARTQSVTVHHIE